MHNTRAAKRPLWRHMLPEVQLLVPIANPTRQLKPATAAAAHPRVKGAGWACALSPEPAAAALRMGVLPPRRTEAEAERGRGRAQGRAHAVAGPGCA